jgi:hypothetical protein
VSTYILYTRNEERGEHLKYKIAPENKGLT